MSQRTQSIIALLGTGLGILALAVFFFLTMTFPRVVEGWAEREQALSGFEQMLAQASQLSVAMAPLLFPLAGLWVLGCGLWAVVTCRGGKRNSK